MKKKCLLLVCVALFCTFVSVSALLSVNAAPASVVSTITENLPESVERITRFSNGAKLIAYKPIIQSDTRGSLTAAKNYDFVRDDVILWRATLTGSFTYDGITSTCTSASCTTAVYNNAWSEKSVNSYCSNASAIAEVTMVRKLLFITVETIAIQFLISCNQNGILD